MSDHSSQQAAPGDGAASPRLTLDEIAAETARLRARQAAGLNPGPRSASRVQP